MFSIHTTLEKFENRDFNKKQCVKCFLSTLRPRNFNTEVSLWKRIKCFSSTMRLRNLKTEISLRKCTNCFPSTLTTLEKFENRDFTKKINQMFSIQTTPEEFENRSFTLRTEEFKIWSITGHFEFVFQENSVWQKHVTIVMSSFSKSFVFQMISFQAGTKWLGVGGNGGRGRIFD